MKKLLALVLCAALLLTCTGCSAFMEGFQEGLQGALQDAANEANKEIARGTVDGNVYASEYSGLTFTKPDSWTYATDEEIADTMEVGADVIDADSFAETLGQMATVYDMMVIDMESGSNVSIMYENLQLTNGGAMTAEAYADVLKGQFDELKEMNYTVSNTETVSLGGEDWLRMTTSVEYSDISMTQAYYLRASGTVMMAVVITVLGDTELSSVEAMFS